MMAKSNPPAPVRRGRWLRWLAWSGFLLAALALVAYFVVTSNTFFKGFVLPKISQRLNAKLTVGEANVAPFSQIVLHDVKLQPAGHDPLFTARRLRVRYSLFDLLGGKLKAAEIVLTAPTLRVIQKPDGTSNLDPLRARAASADTVPDQTPSEPSSSPQVDLASLTITNGSISYVQLQTNGSPRITELSELNVALSNLKNDQAARLAASSHFRYSDGPTTNGAKINATFKGEFNVDLGADLFPEQATGKAEFAVPKASGAFADASRMQASLVLDILPTQIKQLTLTFRRDSSTLGRFAVQGPFDIQQREGRLKAEVTGIGHEVLSLIGGPYHLTFGQSELAATCNLELKDHANYINTTTLLTAEQFSLTRSNLSTPVINLQLTANATVDRRQSNAVLQDFSLTAASTNAEPFLEGSLSEPMILAWGEETQALGDSAFELALTNLNLMDWRPLLGPAISNGTVNGKLNVEVARAGESIAFQVGSRMADLSAQWNGQRLEQVNLEISARGQLDEFAALQVADWNLALAHAGQPAARWKGSGHYHLKSQEAQLQTELTARLPVATKAFPLPEAQISDGTLKIAGQFSQTSGPSASTNGQLNWKFVGNAQLAQLTGQFGTNHLTEFDADAEWEASMQQAVLDLLNARLSFTPTGRASNQLQVTSRADLSDTNAIHGELNISAESLDVTTLYSVFRQWPPPEKAGQPAPPSPAPKPAPEAAPRTLPFQDFAIKTSVDRFYLDEMALTNFIQTTVLARTNVTVAPLQFALNGAPVSATAHVNLGVPGYRYRFDLKAREVPLAPLVSTFEPAYRDKVGGRLNGEVTLSGAGTTPASVQKNLKGQFNLGATNLNLNLVDVNLPVLKQVVGVVRNLPRLLMAGSKLEEFLGGILSDTRAADNEWLNELERSTINSMALRGQITGPRVQVANAFMESIDFQASLAGEIQLAPNLTNSQVNLPVRLTLRRGLAEKINYRPADTDDAAEYVRLPEFFKIVGPLSAPQPAVDEQGLVNLTAGVVQSYVPEAAPAVKLLDRWLGGGTNATTTNSTSNATNPPTGIDLRKLFERQ